MIDPAHHIEQDPYNEHYHDHYHDYDPQHHQELNPPHHHDDFHQTAYTPPPSLPNEPVTEEEDEGGGPVKPFLEHLEDFRWVLIKCVVATIVGMVICLAAGDHLMEVIKWPLKKSADRNESLNTNQVLVVMAGTNVLAKFSAPPESTLNFGTNPRVAVELRPITFGSNTFLAFVPTTNPPAAAKSDMRELLNLRPAGGFIVAFQLAIYGGIVLASPFLIFFIGQFLLPALKLNEKHYLMRGFVAGVVLFLGGVSFCYFKLMPLALDASAKYSQWLGISADQWTAEDYISFVCKFMLGMGLGFEMPVVILVLVKLGVLNYRMLAGFRRYMIVINLVLGAVLTTPEVLTQVMMAIPLQILYEITVWIAWYWERRDRKREERAAAAAAKPTAAR
ncbi:hypothetical protein LBMAG56_02040 [Verrucomicrobiota bacterium]|nr:hypothetical protein LBMAG56_02040 [Verrucomicrobiota bacterium]